MKAKREIIKIDEEKCTGCGECIIACAEGALEIVDGKAKLVGDILCDGLGACLGECPEGALEIVEREAAAFDEEAVEERLKDLSEGERAEEPASGCGCPGAAAMVRETASVQRETGCCGEIPSCLGHWPVKLQLLGPKAPFLKDADLFLVADCVGIAYPEIHRNLISGKAVAIGCPKLDDLQAHIDRLALILKEAKPRSLTVVHMEVPCCFGFVHGAQAAVKAAGVDIPLKRINISRFGEILEEEDLRVMKG